MSDATKFTVTGPYLCECTEDEIKRSKKGDLMHQSVFQIADLAVSGSTFKVWTMLEGKAREWHEKRLPVLDVADPRTEEFVGVRVWIACVPESRDYQGKTFWDTTIDSEHTAFECGMLPESAYGGVPGEPFDSNDEAYRAYRDATTEPGEGFEDISF